MVNSQFNLFALKKPEIRTLHLTWFAFFISFMVWFAHAPLMVVIRDAMQLSEQEVKILLILNAALTIPARIVVGMLVDKYGPRQLFSSILILGGLISIGFAYALTFGAELAVVSMLPLYYVDTFNVEPVVVGILAGIYPVINLFARPAGGWLSDKIGRKITLGVVSLGAAVSFFILSKVTSDWALWSVVVATILAGIFSKAGSGAVYAMVPLIQRRMTGQFAGMVGAFGNVAGLAFLTILSFVSADQFFLTIAATAAFVLFVVVVFLDEPTGHMVVVLEDGTVEMIEVK